MSLQKELPAYAFADMIRVIDEVYVVNLWLDHTAEQKHMLSSDPRSYTPEEEEMLQIYRIEVGTPDFLELIGLADPLIQVLGFIGSALALTRVVVSIRQKMVETQKVHAETRKLDAEIKRIELEVSQLKSLEGRAENFHGQGKINEDRYKQIKGMENLFRRVGKQVIAKYASDPSLALEVHNLKVDNRSQPVIGEEDLRNIIQVNAVDTEDSTQDRTH
jgi:hypothetical protein